MSVITELIKTILDEQDDVTITAILTWKCNFECSHCFYGCGPEMSRFYMRVGTFYKVLSRVDNLRCHDIPITLNLIGGEPTINLKKFDRIMTILHSNDTRYDCQLCMTTNGWWLEREKSCHAFFEAVKPLLDEYPDIGGMFIRISDDIYHREFHKTRMNFSNIIKNEFTDEWTGFLDYAGYDEDDCLPPENHSSNPWLYTEHDLSYAGVCPSGIRGRWGSADHGAHKECFNSHTISYDPYGNVSDGCGYGSCMPFGTVEDNPLVILGMIQYFQRHYRKSDDSCMDCRELAKKFKRTKLFRELKAEAYEYVNSLELEAENC